MNTSDIYDNIMKNHMFVLVSDPDVSCFISHIHLDTKRVEITFLMHPRVFTWLDKYTDQRNKMLIRLLARNGDSAQDIILEKCQLLNEMQMDLSYSAPSDIIRGKWSFSYEKFIIDPVVPNEDLRGLFKKFIKDKNNANV